MSKDRIVGYAKPHIRLRRGRWEYIYTDRNRRAKLTNGAARWCAEMFCQSRNGEIP